VGLTIHRGLARLIGQSSGTGSVSKGFCRSMFKGIMSAQVQS
jgi:hypothetical protein